MVLRLCKARKYRYKHKDMKDLEQKLDEAQVRQQGITFMNILSLAQRN